MNDRKSLLPDDAGQPGEAGAPLSPSRRRFARGAAPVVLGSLVSSPVLGAEYICTLSGFASGNMSAHLTDGVDCDVGNDVAFWRVNNWPLTEFASPLITKGGLPKSNCNWETGANAVGPGTLFNGFPAGGQVLANTFYFATGSTSGCGVGTTSGSGFAAATMRQVLETETVNSTEVFRLGRAVIASLLNVRQFSSYPVSQERIISMFNAVKDGGSYHVEGANLDLSRLGVIKYLESLYS